MFLSLLNLALIIIVLFFVLVLLIKIKKIHLWTYEFKNELEKKTENVISQIEALLGLYADLELKKSIPKTRSWAGSPDFLWNIARLAQKNKPQVVVECSSGVSTVVLAQSVKINGVGHIYSLDQDSVFAEKTREELKRHGLSEWATVIDAPLVNYEINGKKWEWYSLDKLIKNIEIDMLVIDGPPAYMNCLSRYPAGHLLFKYLRKNSIITLDDYNRDGEKKIVEMWEKDFKSKFEKYEINCEKGLLLIRK